MAILNFTQADRLASTILPTEYYTAEITEIDGPKKSSSEKSFSFYTTFLIIEGPYAGKELKVAFNTGNKSSSMLNGMQYTPTSHMLGLIAAIENVGLDAVKLEGNDTDALLRRPLDIKVEKGIYDGTPGNMILAFLPKGAGAAAAKAGSPF